MSEALFTKKYNNGVTITIRYDDSGEHPSEYDEGYAPVIIGTHNNDIIAFGIDDADILPKLDANDIRKNAADIADFFGHKTLLQFVGYHRHDHYFAEDAVNAAIEEEFEHTHFSDQMEIIKAVWEFKGCKTFSLSVTGYSQGEYYEIVAVGEPGWIKKIGVPEDMVETILRTTAEDYAAWSIGDSYLVNVDEGNDGTSYCDIVYDRNRTPEEIADDYMKENYPDVNIDESPTP